MCLVVTSGVDSCRRVPNEEPREPYCRSVGRDARRVRARAVRAPEPAKLELIKIKDDLFVIHNEFVPGNTTVLVTNEGVVLVDDKFEIDHDNIMAQLKTITNQPVKYVINTHYHGDHSGGNAKLQALRRAGRRLRGRHGPNMVDGNQPGIAEHHGRATRCASTSAASASKLYYFGRAHTNGDVVVLFPEQRVVVDGRHVHRRRRARRSSWTIRAAAAPRNGRDGGRRARRSTSTQWSQATDS